MFTDITIPILVFLAVLLIGLGIVLAMKSPRRPSIARIETQPNPYEEPSTRKQSMIVSILGALGGLLSFGKTSDRLRQQLNRAGFHRPSAAMSYVGMKFLLLFVVISLSVLLIFRTDLSIIVKSYLICMSSAVGFFLPNIVIRIRYRRRQAEIKNHLPDAVDLLEICVSSGMGLDQAWNAVSDEIRMVCPTLADEMALVNLEVQLGSPRTVAMRNMANRTGAEELSGLVAMLVQSERFGTSISEALQTYASTMRETRSMRAEEEAEKMAIKLLFPLIIFIFPVMLIVMVGPAGMVLYEVMGNP